MEFIKPGINLDFVGKRYIAITCSLILILVGVISLIVHHGPKYGIDFKGGTIVQIKFKQPVTIASIKAGLDTIRLRGSAIQQFGDASNHEYRSEEHTSELQSH